MTNSNKKKKLANLVMRERERDKAGKAKVDATECARNLQLFYRLRNQGTPFTFSEGIAGWRGRERNVLFLFETIFFL